MEDELINKKMRHHKALDVEKMHSSCGPTAARLSRRRLLSQTPIVMCCAVALRAQSGEPEYVEATTVNGRVRGMKHPGLVTFKGIPYGASVSGANRFKAAPPLKPWTGVRDALQLGAPCWQPRQLRNEPPQNEDCLFLNVWTPAADGRRRPVMFYSHGGGFTTGSAGAGYQDASGLGAHLRCSRSRHQSSARPDGVSIPGRSRRRGVHDVRQPGNARHSRRVEMGARQH